MAVQVSGKTRGTIQVAKASTQDAAVAAAMADPAIAKFVTGAPKKIDLRAGAAAEHRRLRRRRAGRAPTLARPTQPLPIHSPTK